MESPNLLYSASSLSSAHADCIQVHIKVEYCWPLELWKRKKEKKKQLDSFAAAVVKSLLIWTQLDCIIIDEEWEIP